MDLQAILTFLSDNQKVVIGAAATISEVLIIIVNLWRKTRAEVKKAQLFATEGIHRPTPGFVRTVMWSAMPWNLLRKP